MSNKILWRATIYSALNVGTNYNTELAVPKMNILVYDVIQMAYEYGMQLTDKIPLVSSATRFFNYTTGGWSKELAFYIWSIGAQGLFNLLANGPTTALIDSILILVANYMGNKVRD